MFQMIYYTVEKVWEQPKIQGTIESYIFADVQDQRLLVEAAVIVLKVWRQSPLKDL